MGDGHYQYTIRRAQLSDRIAYKSAFERGILMDKYDVGRKFRKENDGGRHAEWPFIDENTMVQFAFGSQ